MWFNTFWRCPKPLGWKKRGHLVYMRGNRISRCLQFPQQEGRHCRKECIFPWWKSFESSGQSQNIRAAMHISPNTISSCYKFYKCGGQPSKLIWHSAVCIRARLRISFMIGVERAPKCEDKEQARDFPGSSVVNNAHFQCRGHGFDPWLGN